MRSSPSSWATRSSRVATSSSRTRSSRVSTSSGRSGRSLLLLCRGRLAGGALSRGLFGGGGALRRHARARRPGGFHRLFGRSRNSLRGLELVDVALRGGVARSRVGRSRLRPRCGCGRLAAVLRVDRGAASGLGARAGRELEADLAVGLADEEGRERAALLRDEAVQEIGPSGREQLHHLLGLDRPLQDDLSGAEIARPPGSDGALAHVGELVVEDARAAFRAWAERRLAGEIDRLGVALVLGALSEIELGREVVPQFEHRRERTADAAPKALQRTDCAVPNQGLGLLPLDPAASDDLPDREVALRALELLVVLVHRAAALRALDRERRDRVVGERAALDPLHEIPGRLDDVLHELFAPQLPMLHLLELELPGAGELGRAQLVDAELAERIEEVECLRGRMQLAAHAMQVVLEDEAFDDRCPRSRRAEPLLAHRLEELLVVNMIACPLPHRL